MKSSSDSWNPMVSVLQVMGSYLTNRLQVISINGARSQPDHVVHGVPQGSVHGPTLFLGDDKRPRLLWISFTVCWRHKTCCQGWWSSWGCTSCWTSFLACVKHGSRPTSLSLMKAKLRGSQCTLSRTKLMSNDPPVKLLVFVMDPKLSWVTHHIKAVAV